MNIKKFKFGDEITRTSSAQISSETSDKSYIGSRLKLLGILDECICFAYYGENGMGTLDARQVDLENWSEGWNYYETPNKCCCKFCCCCCRKEIKVGDTVRLTQEYIDFFKKGCSCNKYKVMYKTGKVLRLNSDYIGAMGSLDEAWVEKVSCCCGC